MRTAKGTAALIFSALAASCIPNRPMRTFDFADPSAKPPAACTPEKFNELRQQCNANNVVLQPGEIAICTSFAALRAAGPAGEATRRDANCVSEEKFPGVISGIPDAPGLLAPFDLHVVEFDDEGQAWNIQAVDRTMQVLTDQLARPAVVVMFVHGWKNNADVCNGNLSCFRDVLEILSKAENAYSDESGQPPRRVIGIYVGWRGGSIKTPIKVPDQLTFFGRKHTAHTIGDNGAVTGIIARVRVIVDAARKSPGRVSKQRTSLVFVGHSFGGALLMSALTTSLSADINSAIQQSLKQQRSPVESFPGQAQQRERSVAQPLVSGDPVLVDTHDDLVVLINPATEASRFANIYQATHASYHVKQMPIFITVASEADSAVGFAFPLGQAFTTLFRAARSRPAWFSMVEGLGMYQPYHTHRLTVKPDSRPLEQGQTDAKCWCPSNLRAYGDELIDRLRPLYRALGGTMEVGTRAGQPQLLKMAAYQEYLFSRLEPTKDLDPNVPFLMVQADKRIISGHSDIFNPTFMDFLIEYVLRTEVKREIRDMEKGKP